MNDKKIKCLRCNKILSDFEEESKSGLCFRCFKYFKYLKEIKK